jgi:hypothetical protein
VCKRVARDLAGGPRRGRAKEFGRNDLRERAIHCGRSVHVLCYLLPYLI